MGVYLYISNVIKLLFLLFFMLENFLALVNSISVDYLLKTVEFLEGNFKTLTEPSSTAIRR